MAQCADTTSYSYDQGQLSSVVYTADPANTPAVYYTYDDFGRPATVTQAGNTHTYAYDPATLVLTTETIGYDTDADGTPDFTRALNRTQDNLLRPSGINVEEASSLFEYQAQYTYDTAGRLHTVTNNTDTQPKTFTYGYLANSGSLLQTVTGPIPHRNKHLRAQPQCPSVA